MKIFLKNFDTIFINKYIKITKYINENHRFFQNGFQI